MMKDFTGFRATRKGHPVMMKDSKGFRVMRKGHQVLEAGANDAA